MKKRRVLSIIWVIAMLFSYMSTSVLAGANTVTSTSFKDMPAQGHWSRQALEAAVENGLLNGFKEKDGDYIRPNDSLTRAQLATIVNRAFEAKDLAVLTGVSDVPSDAWYYKDIQKAVKMGTMKLDKRMRPNDKITRQEAFTILGRALDMESGSMSDIARFRDASQVANWALPSMGSMVKEGYIKGSNNLLNPKSNMTRAEFAVVMDNVMPLIKEINNEAKPISPPDFNTEQGIRDYLIGQWSYEEPYLRDITCEMNIDKDLNVNISFENSYSDAPKGNYKGKISFDRAYADFDEAPDLISLELLNTDEPGGDFFFTHRTIYDNKRVMSWFFAGNGNTIFDVLDTTGEYMFLTEEVVFEKITGEKSKETANRDDEFYAVYWGMGSDGKSMWLDDVEWVSEEMTEYETDIQESVLYKIVEEEILEVLGEEITKGSIYYVETNSKGEIKHFIPAEKKQWIDNNYITPEIRNEVIETLRIYDEINYYLDMGMTILFEGNTVMINGLECYEVILGTDHEEHFVRERFYAVDTATGDVYWYDILNDSWELLGMG